MTTPTATYLKLDTIIHSGIVSAYRSVAIKVWYLARSFDVKGEGKVTLLLEEAMLALRMSKRQIQRHIDKLVADGLFRKVTQQGNKCTIYLASAEKVALAIGCQYGTCFWLNTSDLVELRSNVINANFQAIQKQADYRVKKDLLAGNIEACLSHQYLTATYAGSVRSVKSGTEAAGTEAPSIDSQAADTEAPSIDKTQPLKYGNGVIGFVEKNSTLLVSEYVKIGFASSATVAKVLQLSLKTLYNHMRSVPKLRIGLYRANNSQLREAARLSGSDRANRFVNFKRQTKGDLVIEMSGFVVMDLEYVFASKAKQKSLLKGLGVAAAA
jgi:hypothetical protein